MIRRIHVNKHKIAKNNKVKTKDREPPIAIRSSKGVEYCNSVDILDKNGNVVATLKYAPDKPLSCGAKVYIELSGDVRIGE